MRLALLLVAGAALVVVPASAQPAAPPPAPVAVPVVTTAALGYRLPGHEHASDEALDRAQRPAAADSLRPPDDWLGRDKALHVGASFLLTLSGQYMLTDKAEMTNAAALPLAAGAALALGLAKEVADSRRTVGPHFSLRDLAADVLGVAVGALVTRL